MSYIYQGKNLKIFDNYLNGVGSEFVDFDFKSNFWIINRKVGEVGDIKMKGFDGMIGDTGSLKGHFSMGIADDTRRSYIEIFTQKNRFGIFSAKGSEPVYFPCHMNVNILGIKNGINGQKFLKIFLGI